MNDPLNSKYRNYPFIDYTVKMKYRAPLDVTTLVIPWIFLLAFGDNWPNEEKHFGINCRCKDSACFDRFDNLFEQDKERKLTGFECKPVFSKDIMYIS